jgi:hypothetical protein
LSKIAFLLMALAAVLVCLSPVVPARAQSIRTFVWVDAVDPAAYASLTHSLKL